MKQITLKPDLQEISDRLPKLIRVIESQVKDGIQTDLQRISDQIARKPDERELIIKKHREIADNRYNELINSGLRITATDEERTCNLIRLYIITKDTWKIPMPKDCSFQSIEPQPYGHIRAAIYPVYYQYNLIQACNDMLNPTSKTPPNGIDEESKGKITMQEAVLILIYRNVTLKDTRTDPEKGAIIWAKSFGFESPTSGDKLLRLWQKYSKPRGITGFDETDSGQRKMIKNMITRIEKITPYLKKPEQQARAADDIQKLKMKLN